MAIVRGSLWQRRPVPGGTFNLAEDVTVTRMGYGTMHLAGPHVFGPPADRNAAVAVLREGPDVLDVVNLRVGGFDRPTPGSISEPFTALAQVQQRD